MLKALAQRAMSETAASGEIDLRVADIVNAAFAGLCSAEGRVLLRRLAPGGHGDAPLIAALARLSETDDIHLTSCITPGSVVIPVALAAVAAGADAERFGPAVAAGYAAGLRLGMAFGGAGAMAAGIWPTMVAAPAMAAVTASVMRGADAEGTAHAMAIALSGRSGRIGRPLGAATSRWLSFARAVAAGVEAAADAAAGVEGDLELVLPSWLAAQAAANLTNAAALGAAHGPGIADTGYKPFATARQGATAIAAFQQLLADERLDAGRIERVLVEVPAANHTLVARPLNAADRLSTLSSAGYQLGAAAIAPDLLFDAARLGAPDDRVLAFARRVEVRTAADLDALWPGQWAGRVIVETGGRTLRREMMRLPTDPGSDEVEAVVRAKFARMARHRPAQVDLRPYCCAKPAGRDAIWRELLSLCETRRKELPTDAHH